MHRPSRYTPYTFMRAAHWSDQAACRDQDLTIFYPEDFPAGLVLMVTREAKSVCARCPVIEECLKAAMARSEPNGVWGGLDKDERRILRRREQRRHRRAARKQGGGDDAEAAAGTG
ncbi:WhiB family transcriptional regulator [Streptomyces sp. AGS-58]|uniref:WhiB family transcriptional regulator n=1 Tax=unclassified Streptomyces TaxID=2593676 RepID=UPI0035A3BF1E